MKSFIIIALAVLGIVSGVCLLRMFTWLRSLRRLVMREVDLTKVPDGTFEARYHDGQRVYDVRVRVREHRVASIRRIRTGMTAGAAFDAAARLGEPPVDVVAGASIDVEPFDAMAIEPRGPGKAIEAALSASAR